MQGGGVNIAMHGRSSGQSTAMCVHAASGVLITTVRGPTTVWGSRIMPGWLAYITELCVICVICSDMEDFLAELAMQKQVWTVTVQM